MGCFRAGKTDEDDEMRKEANRKIEKQLQKDKQAYRATHRLLLLGIIRTSVFYRRHILKRTSGYAMVVHGRPKTPKNTSFLGVTQPPWVAEPLYSRRHPGHVTCVLV